MTERFLNLVVPLAHKATAMRIADTSQQCLDWSGAVTPLIGGGLRQGDVDSTNKRSTPTTPTMPGIRTSTTATRTTTTSRIKAVPAPSADQAARHHADFSFTDLVEAYFDCRKSKRNSPSALAFEQDLERNLIQLDGELRDGTYKPGLSLCFVVTRPKPREVWAADFRDRIVHHLFCIKIAPRFYATFIKDTCACIPGRGTMYAVDRLEAKIRSATENWTKPVYYLKIDLANFFVAIDKSVVLTQLAARIHEPWWLALAETILMHDPRLDYEYRGDLALLDLVPPHKRLVNQPPELGLPIGNFSSQFFANVYLNALDQFAKHGLRIKHYIRYVDDIVMLHECPHFLNAVLVQISHFLQTVLGASLNPTKTIIQPVDRGVDFVGAVIKPHCTKTRLRTVCEAVRRIASIPADEVFASTNSYFGLMRQASSSHVDRAHIAKAAMRRGHCVNHALTKTYRTTLAERN